MEIKFNFNVYPFRNSNLKKEKSKTILNSENHDLSGYYKAISEINKAFISFGNNGYTEKHKAEIISLIEQGKTVKETAEELGCCPQTINNALKRWGIPQEYGSG